MDQNKGLGLSYKPRQTLITPKALGPQSLLISQPVTSGCGITRQNSQQMSNDGGSSRESMTTVRVMVGVPVSSSTNRRLVAALRGQGHPGLGGDSLCPFA